MNQSRSFENSNSVSYWFPNYKKSFKSNCHDQEAFTVDSNILQWIYEVGEEKDVDGGVDIDAMVSDDHGKKQQIDEGKSNEALNKIHFIEVRIQFQDFIDMK